MMPSKPCLRSMPGLAVLLLAAGGLGLAPGCATERNPGAAGIAALPPQWQVDKGPAAQPMSSVDRSIAGRMDGGPPPSVSGVAARCARVRAGREPALLSQLVADLYATGSDPAAATEGLLAANCGTPAAIVSEMVAQGGPEVVDPVVDRALLLTGPDLEPVIAAAVLVGLARPIPEAARKRQPRTYGMAYFATRAADAMLATAPEPQPLYRQGAPGYGLYTFVLFDGDLVVLPEADRERHRELMRLLESYVLSPGGGVAGARPSAHAFLVAVDPRPAGARVGVTAGQTTGGELATVMRGAFLDHLRAHGEAALAEHLAGRPGPLLVSSREPRLVPGGEDGPRLLVDLSGIGVEYLYTIVDAYDRAIGGGGAPSGGELEALRQRLARLLPSPDSQLPAGASDWILLLPSGAVSTSARVQPSAIDPAPVVGALPVASGGAIHWRFKGPLCCASVFPA